MNSVNLTETEAHRSKESREPSPSEKDKNDRYAKTFLASLEHLEPGKHSQRSVNDLTRKFELIIHYSPEAFVAKISDYMLRLLHQVHEKGATIKHLLGGEHMYGLTHDFPPTPPRSDLRSAWDNFSQCILDAVGPGHTTPLPGPGPYTVLAHHCLESIASGRMADTELANHMQIFENHSISPHSQQALLSALFRRWMFQSPEPIFTDSHPSSVLEYLNMFRMTSKCVRAFLLTCLLIRRQVICIKSLASTKP
jgi:hypothetical protein